MKNLTSVWFEIPAIDKARAIRFYETVFEVQLQVVTMGEDEMAWLPYDHEGGEGAPGSLVFNPKAQPVGAGGPLIYLGSPSGDVAVELGRVVEAGGKVVQDKTPIGEGHGFFGLIEDTEGNHIGIHSK